MSNVYALLVGIDFYANPRQAPHLRGCVTDVEGTHYLLVNRLGIPDANILMLTARGDGSESAEHLATRENIIRGWREHLGQAGQGDSVFFNYSGHGSTSPSNDPNELDGYDEGLVAHDCRMPGVYDILDKELAVLIQEVEAKGAHVSVFLDCCHSGSGTRGVLDEVACKDDQQPRTRQCVADERIRPPETLLDGVAALPATTRSTKPAKPSPSGWGRLSDHVLLAGCRDEELSHEYRSPETRAWQGATTYFFHKALNNYHAEMTWQDIHDFVYPRVHAVYARQSPQLEGPRNQKLFGGLAQPIAGYLRVLKVEEEDLIKVDGGAAIGLAPNGRLAVYRPQSDLQGASLTKATIEEVKVDHAWARLDQPMAIAVGSRVKIVSPGHVAQKYGVCIDDPSLQEAINESPFLTAFTVGATGEMPTFWVTNEHGCYVTRDGAGTQLINEAIPATVEGCAALINGLEHLAVYRNVLLLHNPMLDADLSDAINIQGVTFTELSRGGTRSSPKVPKDPKPIQEDGGESVLESGQYLSLNIRNTSSEPLYIALFNLNSNFGITRLYPRETSYRTIAPNAEIPINMRPRLDNPNIAKGVESYKVFVTRNPTSFDVLEMPDLNEGSVRIGSTRATGRSALSQLLNAARHDGTRPTELLEDEEDETIHHWTTAQLDVTILSPTEAMPLASGQRQISLNDEMGLSLSKPDAFTGALTVSSVTQATRGVETDSNTCPPPSLDSPEAAHIFRPIRLGEGTRASEASPMVVSIDADPEQLASITPDNPLHLSMVIDEDSAMQGIVPIAYDGEFYYPVGQQVAVQEAPGSRATVTPGKKSVTIQIDSLPASVDEPSGDEVGTRNLKRTARLFFYKIFSGTLPADTGVRKVRLAEGKLTYEPVDRADIRNADRIALMIHGFTSDTQWLAVKLWPLVQSAGLYDLCLTYDYETFATGIKENGRLLSESLADLGFGPEDGRQLDIFSHSMGTQVARALIELWGGDGYVDRAFMGGPPNAGSPLAKARRLLPWLSTLFLNSSGTIPAALLAKWLLKTVSDNGPGMADLDPDSGFYAAVNGQNRAEVSVPYYIQIGDNSAAPQDWNRLYQKVMRSLDGGLDKLFDGDHDLAVGLNSAKAIPCDKLEKLPGNHFQYFHSDEGWPSLKEWLEA